MFSTDKQILDISISTECYFQVLGTIQLEFDTLSDILEQLYRKVLICNGSLSLAQIFDDCQDLLKQMHEQIFSAHEAKNIDELGNSTVSEILWDLHTYLGKAQSSLVKADLNFQKNLKKLKNNYENAKETMKLTDYAYQVIEKSYQYYKGRYQKIKEIAIVQNELLEEARTDIDSCIEIFVFSKNTSTMKSITLYKQIIDLKLDVENMPSDALKDVRNILIKACNEDNPELSYDYFKKAINSMVEKYPIHEVQNRYQ